MPYRKIYFLLIIFFTTCTMYAQVPTGPQIAWQRCYGGSGDDFFSDAILSQNAKIIITSQNISNDGYFAGKGSASGWVAIFNDLMEIEWEKFYSYEDCNYSFTKIQALPNNNFVLGGTGGGIACVDLSGGESDICLMKINYDGDITWQKFYGSITGSDLLESMLPTLDGGYLLTGYTNGSGGDIPFHYGSGFTNDVIIIKTDSLGEILWLKVLGGSGNDLPIGDVVEIDRGYYIINIGTYSNDYDLTGSGFEGLKRWIIKLDSLGNIVDESFMQGNVDLYTYTNDMVVPYKDGIMVVGIGNANSLLFPTAPEHALEEGAVAIFNADLELTFFKQWGGGHIDGFKRVVQDENGNFIFLGYSESIDYDLPGNYNGGETVDYWLFATDSNFNALWSKNFGGSDPCGDLGCSNFSGNLVLKDNMLYAFIKNVVPETLPDYDIQCGTLGEGNTDAWLVAFDLTTAIQQENIPQQIFAITPNPANNTIFISSTIAINAPLQITLTSLNGILVFNEEVYFKDTLQLNILDLPDGMYIIQCMNTSVQNTQLLLIIQP